MINDFIMKRVFKSLVLAVFCFLFLMPGHSFADGKYFPAKAYRTSPVIHSQRAILRYKDGIETLVIESSFDGKGKDFGWVIPLPSKPTKFEEASAGFLETLSQTIQPKIVHDLTGGLPMLFGFTGMVGVFFIVTLFTDSKNILSSLRSLFLLFFTNSKKILSSLLSLFLLFCLFVEVFMPSLGVEKGVGPASGRRGVDVLDAQEVGSFGLVVLEADDPDALNGWLTENEFAKLNYNERRIVSDYIQEGWCFVAARLRRDGKGYTQPHPLAMTFKTQEPVYPMRLTAAADSEVYLELFVIADKTGTCPTLTTEYARQLSYDSDAWNGKPGYGKIGHPEMNKYLWDGCVLTRFCNVLEPKDMKKDVVVKLADEGDYIKWYYSHKGAFDSGMKIGLVGWSSIIIVLSLLSFRKNAKPMDWKAKIVKIFIPATCFLFVSWGVFYLVADKVKVSDVKGGWIIEMIRDSRVYHHISMYDSDKGLFDNCKNIADVESKLTEKVFPAIVEDKNYVKVIKLEDSPGNVAVLEDERGLVIRVFGRGGFYEDILLAERGN